MGCEKVQAFDDSIIDQEERLESEGRRKEIFFGARSGGLVRQGVVV